MVDNRLVAREPVLHFVGQTDKEFYRILCIRLEIRMLDSAFPEPIDNVRANDDILDGLVHLFSEVLCKEIIGLKRVRTRGQIMKELTRVFRVGEDRVAKFSTLEVLCSI